MNGWCLTNGYGQCVPGAWTGDRIGMITNCFRCSGNMKFSSIHSRSKNASAGDSRRVKRYIVAQINWSIMINTLVYNNKKFEVDPLSDGKPVQAVKVRRYMITTFESENYASGFILNTLEFVEIIFSETG